MTSHVVSPVIPPRPGPATPDHGPAGHPPVPTGYRRVPVPRLPASRIRASTYGFAAVDNSGRIASGPVLESLGWVPGTTVTINTRGGLIVVTADPRGAARVSARGHLWLPAPVRLWCGLAAGSRILLVADPDPARLVVHPAASLDAMITRLYADVFSGDTRRTERAYQSADHQDTPTEAPI